MKVKVLRPFTDGKKKCLYEVSQIIEVSKERYEEINSTSHGLLVEVVDKKKKEE